MSCYYTSLDQQNLGHDVLQAVKQKTNKLSELQFPCVSFHTTLGLPKIVDANKFWVTRSPRFKMQNIKNKKRK